MNLRAAAAENLFVARGVPAADATQADDTLLCADLLPLV